MKDFQNIEPTEAARRGLRSFEGKRTAQVKNVKGMNAEAQRYAGALGVIILGKWDDPQSRHHRRLYWYGN